MSELGGWLAILVGGLWVTILLTLATGAASIALSSVLAVANVSPWSALRVPARLYVDVLRSVPLLGLLIFIYYGLGPYTARFNLSAFWLAVIGLTLSESAYLAEVYRGGLQAIPASQWEAASSLGLNWLSTVRLVIIPQALPPAVPSSVNWLIAVIKDSSMASLITVNEVTLVATILVSTTFQPMEIYLVLAAMYVALITPLTLAARWLERTLGRRLGLHPIDPMTVVLEPALAVVAAESQEKGR
jgi:polar amino acid transport system permease protein